MAYPTRPAFEPWKEGARCAECPLSSKKPVAPTGPEDAAIAFVGEGPGKWEEVRGEVLVGPSGAKLNEHLYHFGVQRSEVRCFNAIQCRAEVPGETGKRRYDMNSYMAWHRKQNMIRKREGLRILPSPFECCKPWVDAQLKKLETAAIARGAPNGAVIVPMGNYALKACAEGRIEGKVGSIMRFRGSILPVKAP